MNKLQINKLNIEDIPTLHDFTDGIYVRTIELKAGTLAIGEHHKEPHIFQLISGSLRLYDGSKVYEIKAPYISEASLGRKVVYCLEDCIIQNIHKNHNNTRNIDELYNKYIDKDKELLLEDSSIKLLIGE